MKKLITILIGLVITVNVFGWITETGTLEEFIYGENDSLAYDNWLSHIVEGIADEDYNIYAPYDRQTNGFGSYTIPNTNQLEEWRVIATAITAWDYEMADNLLAETGLPFELVEFNDTVSGNNYWIIREQLNMNYVDDNGTPDWQDDDELGSFDYGWGVFIFDPLALYPVIITTPHIADDFHTVPIGLKLFRESGAYAFMANGVCREVLYDESYGYYSNSFSLCDPTREEDTVYNSVYQSCCDYMRSTYGHRELSIQVHSYDWNRHQWYSSCQISAGWGKNDPGVPIRDYSQFGWDMVNQGNEYMLEANEVGIHPAVHINDYYAFNCSTYPFYYSNEDTTFAVNTSVDLIGYRYNRQMVYTDTGWNDHLTFEPFFHIEMDELPNCYPQTIANYYWFWGYDPITQRFDYDHLFDNAMLFNSLWIEDLAAVIPALFEFDDGEIPTDTSPLEILSANYNRVELSWQKTNCYDYETYEILYSQEPIANGNYEIWDRSDDYDMNSAAGNWTAVTGLDPNTEYFFQMRVLDANGNYSDLSNEVSCITGTARIRYEKAVGDDSFITFSFNAQYQDENAGFYIYRKAENEPDYSLADSWETNSDLVALNDIYNFTYTWTDTTVTNWIRYSYIAASSDSMGNQYWHNFPASTTPFDLYTIHFMHEDSLLTDDIWFGASPDASGGFDYDYDIDQDEEPQENYVFAEFYEEDWNNHQSMIRQIENGYNFDENLGYWVFRVKSDQYSDLITINALGDFLRDGRKLYLIDQALGQIVDLMEEDYTYENVSGGWRYFSLYWGNILPYVEFANPSNHIYQAGDLIAFSWNISNNYLVENFDVYIITETDEIQIADILPPFFNQINWIVPDGMILEDAKIVVDLLMIDGDRRQYTSDFKFGCVPAEITYSLPAGIHLTANPFPAITDITELAGNTDLYELEDDQYILADQYQYGNGYFAYSEFGYVTLVESGIQGGNDQFELQQGWNIVPNPHLAGCWRDDIRIITPDLEMTFAEAVQFGLIERAIYSFDHGWHEIEYIYPSESFLLYCYQSDMQAKFIPYNDNHNWLITEDAEYCVKIAAGQFIELSDEMILELNSAATDEYDPLYDLFEPYNTPLGDNIKLYTVLDSSVVFTQCNRQSRNLYDVMNMESEWDFALEIEQLEPVTFSLNENDLPEDVIIILSLGGQEYDLSRDGDFTIDPYDFILEGTVILRPMWMADTDNTVPKALSILNYPNPFCPSKSRSNGINIAFSIPNDDNVKISIYNIKGQKVADLVNDHYNAGSYKITWKMQNNANRRISSGVYFSMIDTGGKKEFSKLVIIK